MGAPGDKEAARDALGWLTAQKLAKLAEILPLEDENPENSRAEARRGASSRMWGSICGSEVGLKREESCEGAGEGAGLVGPPGVDRRTFNTSSRPS